MRGHVEEVGKNHFYIVIELGRDAQGKRARQRHTFYGGLWQAEAELVRLIGEIENGLAYDPERMTVSEFLDRWLTTHAKGTVSPKTFERYEEICARHLKPGLGAFRLTKLRPLHIQGFLAEDAKKRHDKKEGELSARTVLAHYRVFEQALNQSVRWQIIATNPAAAVTPPRPKQVEMKALGEADTAALFAAAEGTRLYLPILLAVTTGLRRGELLALRWQDVDLDAGCLTVRQTLEEIAAGLAFKQPKTAKSRRLVPLATMTVQALKRHKAQQKEDRFGFGPGYKDNDLVLPRWNGEPWAPNLLTGAFGDLMDRLDLPRVRFHDLRHSHASQLLRQGVHPKIVSERLGHSTVGITMDVYSHLLPGLQEEAVGKVAAALQEAIDKRLADGTQTIWHKKGTKAG